MGLELNCKIVLGATRTRGLLLRRQPLYPPELRELNIQVKIKVTAFLSKGLVS